MIIDITFILFFHTFHHFRLPFWLNPHPSFSFPFSLTISRVNYELRYDRYPGVDKRMVLTSRLRASTWGFIYIIPRSFFINIHVCLHLYILLILTSQRKSLWYTLWGDNRSCHQQPPFPRLYYSRNSRYWWGHATETLLSDNLDAGVPPSAPKLLIWDKHQLTSFIRTAEPFRYRIPSREITSFMTHHCMDGLYWFLLRWL